MGELRRHPIGKWRNEYRLRFFVETGLWQGAGLRTALRAGFERCFSVEVSPKFVAAVVAALEREGVPSWRYELVLGDSAEALPGLVERLTGPTLWWLDAHYPDRYTGDAGDWLPLVREVRAIVDARRDHSRDVFLMDDLRIYGAKGAAGPLPALPGLRPGDPAELEEIQALLRPTHAIALDSSDGVYLKAFPRGGPVS